MFFCEAIRHVTDVDHLGAAQLSLSVACRDGTIRNSERRVDFGHPECRGHFSQGSTHRCFVSNYLLMCRPRLGFAGCLETRALLEFAWITMTPTSAS